MNTLNIKNATDTVELDDALETALNEIGCEMGSSFTYEEAREWFAQNNEDGVARAVEILDAAISRWYELEA